MRSMILVTGATGNSGSLIVKALSQAGVKCRGLARSPRKAAGIALAGVEIVIGDLTKPSSLEAAFAGVEKVMLISPPSEQVAELEANAVAAAKRAGVVQVVKFSVDGADAKSPVRFARVHAQSEKNIEASGLRWTFLRPTFFMQNFLNMAGTIRSGTIYYDAGDGKFAPIDLADIAAAAVKVLTTSGHEGKIYRLTGPRAYSYGEVAALFSGILGRPVQYVKVSPEQCKEALLKAGVPQWQAEGITELSEATARGRHAAVSDAFEKLTGQKPKSLEWWIEDNKAGFE